MRYRFLIGLLLGFLVAGQALAQDLNPEQVMILLISPSAARPTADQKAALQRLQALRQQPAFSRVKIGTMHFDRPAEAQFATNVLGVDKSQLPCLALVQLDSAQQRPIKKLYAIPRVTRQQLDQVEQMGKVWAQTAGLSLVAPTATNTKDQILASQSIPVNGSLISSNGLYALGLQADGNVVINRTNTQPYTPIWSSGSEGRGGNSLVLGSDGVLRLTGPDGNPVWQSSNSPMYGFYYFLLQNDGNAVIYRKEGGNTRPVWATGSSNR